MTRLFDALRKAKSVRGPRESSVPRAMAPGPAATAVAERLSAPDDTVRRTIVPFGVPFELPSDVLREMTGLRVSLEVALTERIPRTVMFLASQGGEGTSTVAAQFAWTLANDPRLRVLLVDTQAQRPAYRSDGVPVLTGPERAAPRTSEERLAQNLDLMPLPDSSRRERRLSPSALRGSLGAVASGYDWIVLDGPPVLDSADAASLGAIADGIIVVVQAGRTKRPVLTRSVDLLTRAGGRVLGIVLNRRRLEIPEFIYRRL